MRAFPHSVKVRGFDWPVQLVSGDTIAAVCQDRDAGGCVDYLNGRVLIDKKFPKKVAWMWLFHEVSHIMNGELPEAERDWLSGAWLEFCVDNGLLD